MENKRKKIKIYKSLQPPRHPRVAEAAHIALEACIYRLSNVRPHFINCVVDSENSGPNWSLCHDIESSIGTKISVFVAASVAASFFFFFFCRDLFSWLVLGLCCDIL